MDENKKSNISNIILASLFILIILVLAFLFYYFSTKQNPEATTDYHANPTVVIPAQTPPVTQNKTTVIIFSPPAVLPSSQQSGNCFSTSIAEPYRADAFRCMVGNSISDPCFTTLSDGLVYCQNNPISGDPVVIKLNKPLPQASLPPTIQDNWAWFLTLEDGTICSPFTGTRPFFGTGANQQVAYYGCKSQNPSQEIFLVGDLTKGDIWTAQELIINRADSSVVSSGQVNLNTVWQ